MWPLTCCGSALQPAHDAHRSPTVIGLWYLLFSCIESQGSEQVSLFVLSVTKVDDPQDTRVSFCMQNCQVTWDTVAKLNQSL